MITLGVEMHLAVTGEGDLELDCDALMDALLDMESTCDVADSAVSLDKRQRTITVALTARGEDFEAAEACGRATIRAAVHHIGGNTPAWDEQSNSVERVAA